MKRIDENKYDIYLELAKVVLLQTKRFTPKDIQQQLDKIYVMVIRVKNYVQD